MRFVSFAAPYYRRDRKDRAIIVEIACLSRAVPATIVAEVMCSDPFPADSRLEKGDFTPRTVGKSPVVMKSGCCMSASAWTQIRS